MMAYDNELNAVIWISMRMTSRINIDSLVMWDALYTFHTQPLIMFYR